MKTTAKPDLQNGVTVIVCTHNRCAVLAGALESLAASEMPPDVRWEILVVDNNSTDKTRQVIEDFARRYPARFRYLFEPKGGKSHALNSGVANACGEILAFADDDAAVDPKWLHHITQPLLQGDWAGAGGRTLPAEAFTPPPWLPDNLQDCGGPICAYFDLGDQACEMHQAPYGANAAFRKSMFEKYGGYRTDLGPGPNSGTPRLMREFLHVNEDTEFGRRLLAAGERLRYEPSAVVYHPVMKERITKEHFVSWWFDYGRAMIREIGVWPAVWGIPRDYFRLLRSASIWSVTVLQWISATNPQKRFTHRCGMAFVAGRMAELYRRSVSRQSTMPRALAAESKPASDTAR